MLSSVGGRSEATCSPEGYALRTSKYSQCPSYAWLPAAVPHILATHPNRVTFLNVGANKGYDLLSFLQWYTDTTVNKTEWKRLAQTAENGVVCADQCCGVCGSCVQKRPRGSPYARPRHVELHAFEPSASTRALLRRLVDATQIPATVHALAVGNSTAAVYMPPEKPGYEGASPKKLGARRRTHGESANIVNQTTVDEFMRARRIKYAHHVLIDAEGWDGLVLAGMHRTLAARAAGVVEFEHSTKWHAVHPSGGRSLEVTLAWMRGLGYRCFWQANYGALAEATPPCWRDGFEYVHPMSWRNLVCAAREEIVAVLVASEQEAANKTALAAEKWLAKQTSKQFPFLARREAGGAGRRGGGGAGSGSGGGARRDASRDAGERRRSPARQAA